MRSLPTSSSGAAEAASADAAAPGTPGRQQPATASQPDSPFAAASRPEGRRASAPATPQAGLATRTAGVAAFEKRLKQVSALGVEHFNKDYKKGFQYWQANKLLPEQAKGSDDKAAEELLARTMGALLRVCPGLSKHTVGELLGDPEEFYLKVLDAYTATFDFAGISFEAAIRMYLESFMLPGEAQKIDRIINCFGRHYFSSRPTLFRHEDAAYVLAYSVIMLNTDRHSSQVKNKMTQEAFRKNLRGTNGGEDFPQDFLDDIYHSICHTPLKLSGAASVDVAPGTWAALAQLATSPRGGMVVLPAHESHAFDGYMFSLVWGPAVNAMSTALDGAETEAATRTALDGLRLACQLGAHHDVDGVVDAVVMALAKHAAALAPGAPKAKAAFGRDGKAQAAIEALFAIVTRYGDCVRGGWAQVLDLVLRLAQLDLLPPALEELLDATYDPAGSAGSGQLQPSSSAPAMLEHAQPGASVPNGSAEAAAGAGGGEALSATANGGQGAGPAAVAGSAGTGPPGTAATSGPSSAASSPAPAVPGSSPVPPASSRRRSKRVAAAGRSVGNGGMSISLLKSVTQLIALQDPEYDGKATLQMEREFEARCREVLHERCSIADVFADSRFLRPEALQALVAAIIAAPGPLPDLSSSPERGGAVPQQPDWDSVEMSLDLMMVVLLRNRDRLALLWPPVFEWLGAIIKGKAVDPGVVQSAASGVLRLCQRLLPYKPEVAEMLLRGLQLVPGLDPEVAWHNAEAIAADMLGLIQGAASHIQQQWAWQSVCSLLKMTAIRPQAYPVSLEAFKLLVSQHLMVVNFAMAADALVWFVERAALEHPTKKAEALALLDNLATFTETWAGSIQADQLPPEKLEAISNCTSTFWMLQVEALTMMAQHVDMEVRACAAATLQRLAVGAERMGVTAAAVEHGIRERLVPALEALCKKVRGWELRQAELIVRELVSSVAKLVLLYLPQLQALPTFSQTWQGILRGMLAAHATGSEALAEAVPAAAQNMLLALHAAGVLRQGWQDGQQVDLWTLTWQSARKISSSLTPEALIPAANPVAASKQQQQQPDAAAPAAPPAAAEGAMQQSQQQQPVEGAGAAQAAGAQQAQLPVSTPAGLAAVPSIEDASVAAQQQQ